MSLPRRWIARAGGLFGSAAKDPELTAEIESHLQMNVDDNVLLGMSPEEARRQPVLKLGGVEAVKEAYRDQRTIPWIETLWQDLRFGARMLLKNSGFTAIVVLTLALGIGANTAIFSVINGVLLKALPFPNADRLVTLWESSPERAVEQERVSGPNYLDWRAQNTVFAEMGVSPGWDTADFKLMLADRVSKVRGSYVSASFFPTLGGNPLLGRTFVAEEDRKEGPRVAVIGFDLWQRYFGGNPNILGETLTVDTYGRRSYTVVGVMPRDFATLSGCEIWLPLGWMGVTLDERRSAHWHNVLARLKPGVSLAQARSQLKTIQTRIRQTYPEAIIGSEVAVVPLLQQAIGRNFQKALYVLWGVTAGVLLIACANIANLMLARAATRQKEIAVRIALGAGRHRVIRQLLTESVLLALLGGFSGLLMSYWGVKLFVAACPANIPRMADVSVNGTALLFTMVVALVTAVLFSIVPAWQTSRPDLNEVLKEGNRGASAGMSSRNTRHALVIVEFALAIVLLVGAGLMLQSFRKLLAVDRGVRPEQVMTAQLDFSVSGFTTWVRPDATRPQVYLSQLLERVRELPGVRMAGAAFRFLRRDTQPSNQTFMIFGRPALPDPERPTADINAVTPGYVGALGISLLLGRDFNETDVLQGPGVVLVNESFVRRFFPNEDPLGQHVSMVNAPGPLGSRDNHGVPAWYEVIGVVGDVKSLTLPPESRPEIYYSYWQFPMQTPTLAVRFTGDPAMLAAGLRRETKAVIPNLPVPEIQLVTERIRESIALPRFQSQLLGFFAGLALLLAACGIYGVLAYAVTQRRREIGVRMALGARTADILRFVIGQGMKLALLGIGAGLVAAFALTRIMQSLL